MSNATDIASSLVEVVPGFSLTNRLILYASILLAPAAFASGIGNNIPTNLGFIGFNLYNQVQWYKYIKARQLHALSLLPPHFNLIYAFSYLAGVSSGNYFTATLQVLGTAAVLILNNVSAWTAWATNQTEGYGVYQFFFFGWRTLDDGWHKFLLVWQIADSILAFSMVIYSLQLAFACPGYAEELKHDGRLGSYLKTLATIPVGAAIMLLVSWPLILWAELIYGRNSISSETDMISVYLFVVQAGLLFVPPII